MAHRWVEAGASFLHLVDLDGARQGEPVNGPSIQRIVQTSGVPCQLGGGLRTEEHLRRALDWGVARVILGTKALEDPAWCLAMCQRFPNQVALGIDARQGKVATAGWLYDSEVTAIDLAKQFASSRLAAIIYTDIGRDGMLAGPNVEATAQLARAVEGIPVIGSGGVTSLDDITRLARAGLPGCIIGRALYEGRIDLKQAIEVAHREQAPGQRPQRFNLQSAT
jgi:phosphoribosylformimino-5-aminoimidazole carboxamide ribotide isomerase